MNATQIRIARPTNRWDEVLEFYESGLGLPRIGSFENHDGYDGIMLGMPKANVHLEITQHRDGSICASPTDDNLLVFYFDTPQKYQKAVEQLENTGVVEVKPENPYWIGKGKSYKDPDGWGIVLFNGVYSS